jgi:hypothetical protein
MARSTTPSRAARGLLPGVLAIVLVAGCDAGAGDASIAFEDWYPEDVSAPPGTRYPCALTAMPRDLPGIPATDRAFVNHVYTLVLEATRAKLELRDLEREGAAAFRAYEVRLAAIGERLDSEPTPEGLGRFRGDVAAAIRLQRDAFAAAVRESPSGAGRGVYARPEAREASRLLIRAWGAMRARYPEAPAELRDSAYHHLCALDLF